MKKQKNKKTISIICAVHNEEKTIPLFYDRIKNVLKDLDYNFEIIFTNNRSTDRSLSIIQDLMKKDSRIKVLTFSRNFGYQCSVQAGMTYAKGDCIITIDVDCEDPPELIPEFLKNWEAGYDIVYGIRTNRPESKILIGMRNLFYKILRFTADTDIILNMAEYGLIANYVRDQIINNKNTFPFLRTEIAYSGYKRYGVIYNREKRIAGETHYNFWRMAIFAIGGILSSSTFPFRLAVYLFPFVTLINLLLVLGDIVWGGYFYKILVVSDLTYFHFLLVTHGIYLARIYKNGLGRPLYIVDWQFSSRELKPMVGINNN
ncbi:MAG: glycosyltransferase family 2 protein [Leptospiraceae bacterium]|nr:glycosyltransferase family 2 protein [Leptospiraceae bacterium]